LFGNVVGGGVLGTLATIAGVFGGGYIGYQLELNLNKIDRQRMQETTQMSLENTQAGVTNVWNNPDSGHFGTVTPTRTFRGIGGEICRDFSQTVEIDGERYQATGTACRERDGLWLMEEVEA
jgi:surface antigen